MTDARVIPLKQMPTRLPVMPTTVAWLLMDRLQPGPVIWGIVGTMAALLWILCVALIFIEKHTRVRFED